MKIAIPTADFPPIEGGISTVTVQVSRELAAQGHEVIVVAPQIGNTKHFDASEPAAVVRYRGYGLGWLRYVPMARVAAPYIDAADCVVAINVAYGGVLARRSRKPYVVFAYGYEFLKFRRNWPIRRLLLRVYNDACRIVAISSFTRTALIDFGVAAEKIDVILPGAPTVSGVQNRLEPTQTGPHNGTGPIILAVGRFVPRKGHETLIRALPRVLDTFPDATLVLVGRGPRLHHAQALVHDLGMADRVQFLSNISEQALAEQYRKCDVFALPAGEEPGGQVEGFGLVYVEANAYGKPVVAGRSGGTTDAVLHEETGLIVEPNDPDAVADALLRILSNPEFGRKLGENGLKRVQTELNWTCFTARLAEILEACA